MTIEQLNLIGICFMFAGLFATFIFAIFLIKKTMPKKQPPENKKRLIK